MTHLYAFLGALLVSIIALANSRNMKGKKSTRIWSPEELKLFADIESSRFAALGAADRSPVQRLIEAS
jgi:hypothetical protein